MAENSTETTQSATTAVETTAPERTEAPAQNQRSERSDRSDRSERSAGPRVMATDLLPELGEGEGQASDQEVANGRAYEVTYIVQANVANAVEETQERVKTLIENAGGALDNVRVSEARRLAYPIDKKTDGVYVVINARFAKELTTELDRFFKLEERVLRHVVLREDA